MGLAAALATERVSRTMAHQAAEDAARGTARLPQTPPVVEDVPMRATTSVATPRQEMSHPAPTISQTGRVVTRSDVVDPVQQALADIKTFTDGQGYVNQVQDDINTKIVARLDGLTADVTTLKAHPSGSTWPDLISRWTSRTWLLPFVSGVATIAATVGATFGSLDPHIAAVSAGVTALFGSIFIAFEKKADGAVRVAQAIQSPVPAPPQAPAHGESY